MSGPRGGSQHNMSAAQAAANVAGSYAVLWANAHHGTEIRGGYERPNGDATVVSEFAETSDSPDDI
jgi:hypothetical protein